MLTIDAHQHFWQFDSVRDTWIDASMAMLQKDFSPDDLSPVLKKNGIDGCVAIQADQSETETQFLLQLARDNDFIFGVVGWVDLQSPDIEERLVYFSSFQKLKGFRHILQGEARRDMMLGKDFKRGMALLNKYHFTFDILIYPDQLSYAKRLAVEFPEQKFVLDHLAKPYIQPDRTDEWKNGILELGKQKNVFCKLSGFLTEANRKRWHLRYFRDYFDVVLESFGTDRILFGSDWPVCLSAAPYEIGLGVVHEYFQTWSTEEKQNIFGRNAMGFYNL